MQGEKFLREEALKIIASSTASYRDIMVDIIFQQIVNRAIYKFFAPFWYLGYESFVSKIELPLSGRFVDHIIINHRDEEWIFQVEKWYRKSYLHGMFKFRSGARWNPSDIGALFDVLDLPPEERNPFSFCDRVLFRDSGYTNINFLGLCITSVLLCFLCLANRLVRLAHSTSAKMAMLSVRFLILVRQSQAQCRQMLQMLIVARGRATAALACNPAAGGRGGGGGRSRSNYFPPVLRRTICAVNERISRWRRSTRPSPNTEPGPYGLDDLGRTGVSSPDQSDLSRFEEIDNVI